VLHRACQHSRLRASALITIGPDSDSAGDEMLCGINHTNSSLWEIYGARHRNGQNARICAAPMLSSTHVPDLNPTLSRTLPLRRLQDGDEKREIVTLKPSPTVNPKSIGKSTRSTSQTWIRSGSKVLWNWATPCIFIPRKSRCRWIYLIL
jgi:hypothetical protein